MCTDGQRHREDGCHGWGLIRDGWHGHACVAMCCRAMNTYHHKRCKRYDISGQGHCLTFSCFRGIPFFRKGRCCRWMLEALARGRERGLYALFGFVIMPEHVHVVLLPLQGAAISGILTALKQPVSKRALLWAREQTPAFLDRMEDRQPNGEVHHRFWQRGGGYDRNLRSPHDVVEKIGYIHANPVRRGLVERAADWPWSSYRAWTTGEDEPIPLDREHVSL